MERLKMEHNLIPFHLLLSITLLLGFNATTSSCTQLTSNPLQGLACAIPNICGQGVCEASNASMLSFDCECNSGWQKIQIGPLTFPSCVLPNCTIDFQCGKGSPLPPSPPPPIAPPPLNLSSSCGIVWCGEGTCITDGILGYTCQCFEGSENVMGLKGLPCFKQCSLGADCNGLKLLPSTSPPPPQPSRTSHSQRIGSTGLWNCLRNLHAVLTMMILLAAVF